VGNNAIIGNGANLGKAIPMAGQVLATALTYSLAGDVCLAGFHNNFAFPCPGLR
jgi:hypothetical protein